VRIIICLISGKQRIACCCLPCFDPEMRSTAKTFIFNYRIASLLVDLFGLARLAQQYSSGASLAIGRRNR